MTCKLHSHDTAKNVAHRGHDGWQGRKDGAACEDVGDDEAGNAKHATGEHKRPVLRPPSSQGAFQAFPLDCGTLARREAIIVGGLLAGSCLSWLRCLALRANQGVQRAVGVLGFAKDNPRHHRHRSSGRAVQ